jgi:hypothetical protein
MSSSENVQINIYRTIILPDDAWSAITKKEHRLKRITAPKRKELTGGSKN